MALVTVNNKELEVKISLFESIQALQRSFSLPLSKVRGATADSNYIKAGLGFRAPGTEFPGVIAKGNFYKKGARQLSLWQKGQEIVVIELKGSKWDRLVVGCEDSNALAHSINSAIS